MRIDRCPTGENITCKKLARRDPLWNAEGVCGTNWSRYVCYNPKTVGTHGVPIVPFKVSPIAYTGSPAGKKKAPPKDDGLPWYAWLGIVLGAGAVGYGLYQGGKAIRMAWRNRPPKGPDAPGDSDTPDDPGYPGIKDAAIDGVDMHIVFQCIAHEQMEGSAVERIQHAVDELTVALGRKEDNTVVLSELGEALASFESAGAFREFLVGEKGAGGMGMVKDDSHVEHLVTLWGINKASPLLEKVDKGWTDLNAVSDLMQGYAIAASGVDGDQENSNCLMGRTEFQLEHGPEVLHEMAILAHLGRYAAAVGESDYAENMSAAVNAVRKGAYTDVADFLAGDAPDKIKVSNVSLTLCSAVAASLMIRAHEADDTAGHGAKANKYARRAVAYVESLGLHKTRPLYTYVHRIAGRALRF